MRIVKGAALKYAQEIDGFLSRTILDTQFVIFGNPSPAPGIDRLNLEDIWVPQGAVLVEKASKDIKPNIEGVPLPVDGLLETCRLEQLLIKAPPGFGKSTLCRNMTYEIAVEARRNKRGWIPVHMNLKRVNELGVWSDLDEFFDLLPHVQNDAAIIAELQRFALEGKLWLFLDGLDEVDGSLLPRVRIQINAMMKTPNRLIITCRSGDYERSHPNRRVDLPVFELQPFSDDQLELFVDLWHKSAEQSRKGWAKKRIQVTKGLLNAHPDVREVARVPLLASVLCAVGSGSRSLRLDRAVIFREAIEYLLIRPEWRVSYYSPGSEGPLGLVDENILIPLAQRIAFDMLDRNFPEPGNARFAITETSLQEVIREELERFDAIGDDSNTRATLTGEYLDRLVGHSATGLLRERDGGVYEFAHRSFQEFLAAEYLGRYANKRYRLELASEEEWEEVFKFIAASAEQGGSISEVLLIATDLLNKFNVVKKDRTGDKLERATRAACVALDMLAEMGHRPLKRFGFENVVIPSPNYDDNINVFDGLWPYAQRTAVDIVLDESLIYRERLRAFCSLSRLGDFRFVGPRGEFRDSAVKFVEIEGGSGCVGTEEPLPMREKKQVPSSPKIGIEVRPFSMAMYPVTNLEFARFVDDGGYKDERWWSFREAQLWHKQHEDFIESLIDLWEEQKELNFAKEYMEDEFATRYRENSRAIARQVMVRKVPLYWSDARFNLPTAPVVGVNWWEARAYCSWFQNRLREGGHLAEDEIVGLPTEFEWEWAASGQWKGVARPFPWGEEASTEFCHSRDFSVEGEPQIVRFGAIPVGFYRHLGKSADDPQDLAGNVWEWTQSLSLPHDESDINRDVDDGLDKRIVRGGSWYTREKWAFHVSFRLDDPPCNAYWDLGFRVVIRSV